MQVAKDSAPRVSRHGDVSATSAAPGERDSTHRVGPNTLIQTLAVVRDRRGPGWAQYVSAQARLPEPLPRGMVDERAFGALVTELVHEFGLDQADAFLAEAGTRTGAYVLRNRIPRAVRALLPRLPRALALRVLLRAVGAHSWTFAGSAGFASRVRPGGGEFTLTPSFVCVTAAADRPMGSYYARAMEVLVRALVAPCARVTEQACVATGHPCCRFSIVLAPPSPTPLVDSLEVSCASS